MGKANYEQGLKLIGIGVRKGLSPCQTVAALSRFITCHMSHCVTCVTIFYLSFKQKKYCKYFPSRCWYVHSDILKEKTALDAKIYLCTLTVKHFLWKCDMCDCRFRNSATFKSHITIHRLFPLQELKKWHPTFNFHQ